MAVAEIGLPKEAAFLRMPARQLTRLLVLDGVQDPGNLGTLLRTALALDWQGVYLLDGESGLQDQSTQLSHLFTHLL